MDRNERGGMPFAVMAVTLLVLSLACGAVMAGYDRATDNAEGIGEDADAVDRAASGIERHIERGLGEIILSVSSDPDLGDMDGRCAEFDRRADEWMDFQFPVVDSGVRAESRGHDLDLRTQSMADAGGAGKGHFPAYLKASGTVDVVLKTSSGIAYRTLRISTDGSYALPLAAEQGSVFEAMAGSNGFTLSQMMEYQLSCLAQSRVINGYGSDNGHPDEGTGDIITPDDVRRAYSNSLSAISLICFRDDGGETVRVPGADLADRLVQGDGGIELDLDAFFAQSLFACIDEMALSWFEYFCGDRMADMLTAHLRGLVEIGRAVKDVLMGDSVFGAQSYICEAMSRSGFSESEWRNPGAGTVSGTVCGVHVSVDSPTRDILQEDWVRHFKLHRALQGNFVLDAIRDILRTAALMVSENSGHGTVVLEVDPSDPVTFAETLSIEFGERSRSFWDMFQGLVSGASERHVITDPFCTEVADRIASESDSFFLTDRFESELRSRLMDAFPERCDDICDDPGCDDERCTDPSHRLGMEDVYSSAGYRDMVHRYELGVADDLEKFDALRNQPGDRNILEEAVAGIASAGLLGLGVLAPVEDTMDGILEEMRHTLESNPHSGIEELPVMDHFRLTDGLGNTSRETLRVVSMESSPVALVSVDGGRCMHNIGFDADTAASYTTVFKVTVRDRIDYELNGYGALAGSMGKVTTMLRDSVENSLLLEIPVVSGWALDGVRYAKSTDIVEDAAAKAAEFLEPILEPLRKALMTFRLALDLAVEKLADIGRYAAEKVTEVYLRIMEPVFLLQQWISEKLGVLFDEKGLEIYNSISRDLQYTQMSMCGFVLRMQTDAASWFDGTKSILRMSLSGTVAGLGFTAGLDFKCRGEVNAANMGVSGFGDLTGDGWKVRGSLDPMMKFSKHVLTLDGQTPDSRISLIMPELTDHHTLDIHLNDDPVLGPMMSNIPLPVPGAKAGIDAGFQIRYSEPEKRGLLINEFESNPAGQNDKGHEWIELMNNSPVTVDLSGWTLSASSDWKNKTMELHGSMGPGEYRLVVPDFVLVNEKGKYTRNGECITLKDPSGDTADKTPTLKDTGNDERTWHRLKDGSTEWTFGKPTAGTTNEGKLDRFLSKDDALDIAAEALDKTFDDVPVIDDAGSCQEFLVALVGNTLDVVIERVTGSVIDASVYAEVRFSDATGSAGADIRMSLRADGSLAEDVLKYMAGKFRELVLHADNPYALDPLGMFTENIGLQTDLTVGIGVPDLFGKTLGDGSEIGLRVTFRTNVAALTHLFGNDTGRPELVCGLRIPDCPLALLPERTRPDADMEHDLWLFRMAAVRV